MAKDKLDNDVADAPPAPTPSERVESWKEIAAYLNRDVRTVQRWEKSEALPVHRHMHDKLGTVYAYKAELDAWWNNRRPKLEAKEAEAAQETRKGRRWWTVATTAAAGVAIVAGLWLWLGREPVLPFEARDWVLITQFENRTGESVLDGTLEFALERELSNSRFVNVVPRERAADALRLMKKSPDTPVDAAIGREIVARDGGISALLTGRVEKLGSTYALSVALVNPANGVTVASLSEPAAGQQQLLPAIARLAENVRETLGEDLALLEPNLQKLEKATTPSLRALQLYSQGRALVDPVTTEPNWGPALEFFRQAIAEDPEFASAHLWLGWAFVNIGKRDEARPYFKRAFELADTTTGHEKYFILGCYYWQYLEDNEKAAQTFEVAVKLYPDDYWTTFKLSELYLQQGRRKEAVPLKVRLAELRPHDWRSNCQAARNLAVVTRSLDHAQPYFQRAQALISSEGFTLGRPPCTAWIELVPAYQHWLRGDVEKTSSEATRVQKLLNSLSGKARNSLAIALLELYWSLGKLKAAEEAAQLISDPPTRQEYMMWSVLGRGDQRRLKELLGTATPRSPTIAMVLARAGLVMEAEGVIRSFEKKGYSSEQLVRARTELALAQGQTQKARALNEETTRLNPPTDDEPFPVDPLRVSRIYERHGELPKAIGLLETTYRERTWAAIYGWDAPSAWMEWQSELARFYRKAGQDEEARKIEAELQKLLVYADADHPIVRQLKESYEQTTQRR